MANARVRAIANLVPWLLLTIQYDAKPAPPQLPTISNSSDVERALGSQQQFDPGYAVAVLQAFVIGQMELGRSEAEITPDMDDLQRRVSRSIYKARVDGRESTVYKRGPELPLLEHRWTPGILRAHAYANLASAPPLRRRFPSRS
jgi:hypothetical protein